MTNTVDQYVGSTAFDSAGNKIGKIKKLYVDEKTSAPKWVAVHTGLFGLSSSLVPLAGARTSTDAVTVAVHRDAVKDAPHLDTDEGISLEQEQELVRHYGMQGSAAGRGNASASSAGSSSSSQGQAAAFGAAGAGVGAGAASQSGQRPEAKLDAGRHVADDQRKREDLNIRTEQQRDVRRDNNEDIIRHEERLNVGTTREAVGTARLHKHIVTEQKTVTVPVTHEEVRIVREPITDASGVRDLEFSEDDREITLHADRIVVSKESVPVERIRMSIENVQEERTVTETIRHEEIDTEGFDRAGYENFEKARASSGRDLSKPGSR